MSVVIFIKFSVYVYPMNIMFINFHDFTYLSSYLIIFYDYLWPKLINHIQEKTKAKPEGKTTLLYIKLYLLLHYYKRNSLPQKANDLTK